jgi:hypothetical protein
MMVGRMIVGRESRSGIGVYWAGFRVVEHDGREGAADIDTSLPPVVLPLAKILLLPVSTEISQTAAR